LSELVISHSSRKSAKSCKGKPLFRAPERNVPGFFRWHSEVGRRFHFSDPTGNEYAVWSESGA